MGIEKILYDNFQTILFTLNDKGVFVHSKGNGLNGLKLQENELLGKNVYDLYKDYCPQWIHDFEKCLEGNSFTSISITQDNLIYKTYYESYVENSELFVKGIALDLSNISNVVMSEKNLNYLFNSLDINIICVDLEKKLIFQNDFSKKNLKRIYNVQLTKTDNFFSQFPEQIKTILECRFNKVLKGTIIKEKDIIDFKGKKIYIQTNMTPMKNGELKGVAILIFDITRSIAQEKKLKESEIKWKKLTDSIPCGVVMHDLNKVIFINNECKKIFKMSNDSQYKGYVYSRVEKNERNRIIELTNKVYNKELNEVKTETTIKDFYDNLIHIKLNITDIELEGKRYILTSIMNIEDNFQSKEKLIKTNKILENVAYATAHDLKTPLRGISNLVYKINQEVLKSSPDNTKLELMRKLVQDSVDKMKLIIDDTLNYTKVQIPNKITYNLLDSVVDCILMIDNQQLTYSQTKNTLIEHSLQGFEVSMDKTQIAQCILNLITNAIKFNNKDKKYIKIRVSQSKDFYRIIVLDNGNGIEEVYQQKIFQLFQRLDVTKEGTGLGLAIVERIVTSHEGFIKIYSKVNKGTMFILNFPKK